MAEFIGATRYCAMDADPWGGQMTGETSVRILILGKRMLSDHNTDNNN